MGGVFKTTLLVFWMNITGEVCVHQEVIEPGYLGVTNGQMEYPDGSESKKVSGRFCQTGRVLLASLASSHSLCMWLDILHRCGLGVTGSGGLLFRI